MRLKSMELSVNIYLILFLLGLAQAQENFRTTTDPRNAQALPQYHGVLQQLDNLGPGQRGFFQSDVGLEYTPVGQPQKMPERPLQQQFRFSVPPTIQQPTRFTSPLPVPSIPVNAPSSRNVLTGPQISFDLPNFQEQTFLRSSEKDRNSHPSQTNFQSPISNPPQVQIIPENRPQGQIELREPRPQFQKNDNIQRQESFRQQNFRPSPRAQEFGRVLQESGSQTFTSPTVQQTFPVPTISQPLPRLHPNPDFSEDVVNIQPSPVHSRFSGNEGEIDATNRQRMKQENKKPKAVRRRPFNKGRALASAEDDSNPTSGRGRLVEHFDIEPVDPFRPQIRTQNVENINREQLIQEAKEQAENAQYSFQSSYRDTINDNSQVRQEVRNGLELKGLYSYSDGFFKRTVYYVADQNGYRVIKEETEPIGSGPQINPEGTIEINRNIDGAELQYSVTGEQLREANKVSGRNTDHSSDVPGVFVRTLDVNDDEEDIEPQRHHHRNRAPPLRNRNHQHHPGPHHLVSVS